MKKLIVIGGPTASGKSALSLRIARTLHTEIISADSRQIYRELNIGTAKPSPAELASVRHHFINFLSIGEDYNAGKYESDSLHTIELLFEKYDNLVIAGGSGLYINALLYGLDELPVADPELRSALMNEYLQNGIESLQRKIEKADPEFAKTADMNNPQRLIRALEVIQNSGKPFSQQKSEAPKQRKFTFDFYCIKTERESLYEKINRRVDEMFEQGLVEEVQSLLPYRDKNALQTVGYKEVFACIDGNISLKEAVELVKKNTRNYAKRQMTWFRKNQAVKWLSADDIYNAVTGNH